MMTSENSSRYARLRMAATLPILLAILCAFAFTSRATEYRSAAKQEPQKSTISLISGNDGQFTINGQKPAELKEQPLYLVDGKECDVNNLPEPSKIESVSVTNNPEILAPYGDKAKHGLVEITTRKVAATVIRITADGDIQEVEADGVTATKIGTDDKPVYVVDGVERENIDDLAPAQIYNVEIHKDEATIAKYGDKAKKGVVIIKTKAKAGAESDAANVNPKFRGEDMQAFQVWVQQNIKYPADVAKDRVAGAVYVKFAVDESGNVVDVEILRSPDERLSKEVERVVKSSPAGAWTPGMQDGKAIKVQMTIPVVFALDALSEVVVPWTKEQTDAFRMRLEDLRAILGDRPEIDLSNAEAWMALGSVDTEQLAALSSSNGRAELERLIKSGNLVKIGEWRGEKSAE